MQGRGYGALCGVVGLLMMVLGLALFAAFFRYHAPDGTSVFPTGPGGHYFIAFSGCATFAWGGCLLAAVREPVLGRALMLPTVLGLIMSAAYRIVVWILGDYYRLGELPRGEAAVFLLLALAFVWLCPPSAGARVPVGAKIAVPKGAN